MSQYTSAMTFFDCYENPRSKAAFTVVRVLVVGSNKYKFAHIPMAAIHTNTGTLRV